MHDFEVEIRYTVPADSVEQALAVTRAMLVADLASGARIYADVTDLGDGPPAYDEHLPIVQSKEDIA